MSEHDKPGIHVTKVPHDMHASCHEHDERSEPTGGGLDRRTFLSACGCATLALSSAGVAMLGRAAKAETAVSDTLLKIGHLPAGCVSHLLLAKARNMFADAGLTWS